jgi:hemoglobin
VVQFRSPGEWSADRLATGDRAITVTVHSSSFTDNWRSVIGPITPTLFERLGGMVSIDVAVDHFYSRVLGDPELASFFDQVDLRRQRAHQKVFLAMALGGPRGFEGRGLAEAHRHLRISDHHVDLVAGHLAAVLAGLGVLPALIDEVVAAIDGLRDEVLGRV